MSRLNESHGLPPANATAKRTFFMGVDTIYYASATSLTEQPILSNARKIQISQYQTSDLSNMSRSRNIVIEKIRVVHNLQFAPIGTQPAGATQYYFENYSYLKIQIGNSVLDQIKLSLMLPYDLVWNGSSFTPIERHAPFFVLPHPLDVPADGDFSMSFVPASNLTTATYNNGTPTLPNLGLTNDYGTAISFVFIGKQDMILR